MWRTQIPKKILLLFSVCLILANSVFTPLVANAVVDPGGGTGVTSGSLADSFSPEDQAKSLLYYNALVSCINDIKSTISVSDASAGKWFKSGTLPPKIGYFLTGSGFTAGVNGDRVGCNGKDIAWITNAWDLWGYTSALEALCSFGAHIDGRVCTDGNGDLSTMKASPGYGHSVTMDSVKKAINQQVYGRLSPPKLSDAATYAWERNAFFVGCLGSANPTPYLGTATPNTNNYVYDIKYVDYKTGVQSTNRYNSTLNMTHSSTIKYGIDYNHQTISDTCWKLATDINNKASAYKKAVDTKIASSGTGYISKATADDSTTTGSSSCVINGVGWIICPVVKFLASVADQAFGFLADKFLNIDTSLLNTDSNAVDANGSSIGTGAYTAWQMMRSFANVVLMIAFLVIIFSQLTNFGVTNYGVKKLLPKLVIVAILINVSFIICQVGVDLSNIAGYGLKSLLTSVSGSAVDITTAATNATASATGAGFSGIAGKVLAGSAAAGAGIAASGGVTLALVALLGVILSAVIALLMIFFILIVRQMLIVLLVVMAPLAFAAYLLPNTEELFTKWRKLLVSMLMLFPVVGLIFGASTLASVILKSVWAGSGNTLGQIIAAAALVLPLFVVPSVLKGALSGIGTIGGKISTFGQGFGTKMANSTGKQTGKLYGRTALGRGRVIRKQAKENFRTQRFAERVEEGGFAAKMAAGTSGFGLSRSQRAQKDAVMNVARNTVAQGEAKDLQESRTALTREVANERAAGHNVDSFLEARAVDPNRTFSEQSAAMQHLASLGRDDSLRRLAKDPRTDQRALQEAITSNAGALIGKAPDLVKGGEGPAFDNVGGEQMAKFSAGTAAVHMKRIQDLHAKAYSASSTPADVNALNTAVASFNDAVKDISRDTSLQATFGAETGRNIVSTIAAASPAFQAYAAGSMVGLASIQPDGKIR